MSRERPILFSSPMVRALLDGRKTQTRRLVKLPPWLAKRHTNLDAAWPDPGLGDGGYLKVPHSDDANISEWMWPIERVRCPHGAIGDRLWVRETHGTTTGNGVRTVYRADGEPRELLTGRLINGMKWTPSIFMRRHQSRITLEITAVRVERIQGISEDDARAEGLSTASTDGTLWRYGIADRDGLPGNDDDGQQWHEWEADPRRAYAKLWESINAKRAPWESNPWVWVIEFRNVKGADDGGR